MDIDERLNALASSPPPAPNKLNTAESLIPSAAEREVVADLLMFGASVADAVDEAGLYDRHFGAADLRAIYTSCRTLIEGQMAVTLATVGDHMGSAGTLGIAGGAEGLLYVSQFATQPLQGQSPAERVAAAARIVVAKARVRAVLDVGARLCAAAGSGRVDADELVDEAQGLLARLDTGSDVGIEVDKQAAIEDIMANDHFFGGRRPVMPTGMPALDAVLDGGFSPGQLVIVAGRPAMGKSLLAMQFAAHMSLDLGLHTAVFSLEMPAEEVLRRMAHSRAGVDPHQIPSREDRSRVAGAYADLAEAPLHLDDAAGISLREMRARVRAQHRRNPLSLIVVDYVQLLAGGESHGRDDNGAEVLSRISRTFKLLARELGLPVVCVAQLNRMVESRQNKRPMMSDLKGSGSLEQDSDKVLLLYREEYYNPEGCPEDKRGVCEVAVAKNRQGRSGRVANLTFETSPIRFS